MARHFKYVQFIDQMNYSITFACYNQIDYTKKCISSMTDAGIPLDRLAIVDNASSDETWSYLQSLQLGAAIRNADNLGCGVAWNQGALALQSEWTIIMNNDVIVSPRWLDGLIGTAEKNNLDIISPAMIEGPLNYDFLDFAEKSSVNARNVLRAGWAHAVCLAVHKRVWKEVGYFRATPKLLGYEDTIFFHEARLAGMSVGTTGASWLHHYGSITQSAMKRERGLQTSDDLGYRYNHRLLHQSWFNRKMDKVRLNRQLRAWSASEQASLGHSLWGNSSGSVLTWN